MKDHYEVLGVSRGADPAQIKAAWRRLARRHHPDQNQGDPRSDDRFREVAEAYRVLIDPKERSAYDMLLAGMSLFSCTCGNPKLPGSDLCRWCALRRAREIEEEERIKRAAAKEARREARRRKWKEDAVRAARADAALRSQGKRPAAQRRAPEGPRPVPGAAGSMGAAERSWDAAGKYMGGAGAPDPDTVLEGMLAHAAIEASADGLDLKVRVGPDGRVRLSGGTVEDMRRVRDAAGVADRMLSGLRAFFGRGS
jgi:curved DNA-binding protein CbpA